MNVNARIERLESHLIPRPNADGAAVRTAILELLENRPDYLESLRAAAVAEDCDPTLKSVVAERHTNVH